MTQGKLPLWTDLWQLSGDMVNCKECHAAQFMQHRQLAFTHKRHCSREGVGQYPYVELLEILKLMKSLDSPLASPVEPIWIPEKR